MHVACAAFAGRDNKRTRDEYVVKGSERGSFHGVRLHGLPDQDARLAVTDRAAHRAQPAAA